MQCIIWNRKLYFLTYTDLKKLVFFENSSIPLVQKLCIQILNIRMSSDVGSSRPETFCKKRVLRNFTKFTGKHLCHSLFFNKAVGLRHATLLKKRLWYRCFPVNFVEFLRTPFFMEHLWWLLLWRSMIFQNEGPELYLSMSKPSYSGNTTGYL